MGLDPHMEEIMRVCDALMPYLNDEEGEELVCFVNFIRQKTVRLYDDSDDFAASVAMSKLQSD
jgi:hypothetical protein